MLGSTGERVNLDEREYLEVIETAREEVATGKDGLAFIVGAGQQSTRGTVNEIKRVAGAVDLDAFLVITPHFYRPASPSKRWWTTIERLRMNLPFP